ncbi:MAG: QacE family quaternary ammonium compound efflux SMR transporter [Candidatus Methanomethylophilaceae archaeon]|jgi:quaternary ammonium compound-resistance protein SugE|nr:QacE family quaternary ammonium compound efflux SMR transporter [Candidatus Methanomethylophilaceae archaeon]
MDKNSKAWLILIVAGFMETVWAVAMDYSDGFTKILYDIIVIVFLVISMVMLSKALNLGLPVGTAYAVWTGVGAVGTIVVSIILGNESAAPLRMLFIGLIVFGIAGLQITSTESKEDN